MRRPRRRVCLYQDRQRVRMPGVRNPGLGAVDDVPVPIAARCRANPLQIGACSWLGEAYAAAACSCGEVAQVAFLLLSRSVHGNDLACEAVAPQDAGDAHPSPRDLLEYQGEGDHVASKTAVFFWHGEPEEPHPLHAFDDLRRISARAFPFGGDRDHFPVDERTQRLPEHPLLGSQGEVHGGGTSSLSLKTGRFLPSETGAHAKLTGRPMSPSVTWRSTSQLSRIGPSARRTRATM